MELYRIWLAIRQGDLAALEHWIQEQNLDLAQPTPPWEAAYVMAARILLARHEEHAELALLEKLLAIAEAGGRGRVVIELLILQALALQAQARPDSALGVVQRVLAFAT